MTAAPDLLYPYLDHIVIDTADLDRSLDFYGSLPGIETGREKGRGTARLPMQKINIHIYPPTLWPVAAKPVIGGQSFCLLASGKMQEMKQVLRERKIIFAAASKDPALPGNLAEFIEISDPDGNRLKIRFNADCQKLPAVITGLQRLDLSVADLSASIHFYARIPGTRITRGKNGAVCHLGQGCLNLWGHGKSPFGAGDFCLVTENPLEKVFGALPASLILADPGIVDRTGARGPIKSFYMCDPDGNLVEIAAY